MKFVTTNLRGNNIFIDDINILNQDNLYINNLKIPSATIYPNPSNGKFIVKLNDNNIHSYTITNAIGNIILQSKIDKMSIEYDMRNN